MRVPATAVVQRGQLEIVFSVTNQRAQLHLVKTGKRVGDEVEILSGLDAGKNRCHRRRGPVDRRPTSGGEVMSSPGSQPTGEIGIAGRIARAFIDSKLTPLIVITAVLLGAAAIILLPREEEPQIKVPMIDVLVSMPGFSAKEVEERATRPMEKLLWEIPGVEYIYSTSRPGESLAIVRFKVGEDVEKSLVKLNQKLQSNFDRIPRGVSPPLIKPRSIDDVPILALTFHGEGYDHLTLRRLVAQVDDAVKQVPLVAETTIIGGAKRQLRVLLDPARLASRNLSAAEIVPMLTQANRQSVAGGITSNNRETIVETGDFLSDAQDVGNVVVGVSGGKPVYLREVAEIKDDAARAFAIRVLRQRRGALDHECRTTGGDFDHRQTARRKRHCGGRPSLEED